MTTDLTPTTPPQPPANISSQELVFFQQGTVYVSNLRCTFGTDTRIYATSGITSVGITSTSQKFAGCLFCFLIALPLLLTGAFGFVIAGLLILLGIYLWHSGRPKYFLSLHTSGGSYQPLWAWDSQYINTVVMAVNQAIVARG